jgi:fimbrial chaperone protein
MLRRSILFVVVASVWSAPPAAAANFTVTPTEINLSRSSTSGLVRLTNRSRVPLRFEITVLSWSEDEEGAMNLTPATDVTFFPKLVELAAGATRNIRVGIEAAKIGDTERTFRLFVEELPDQTAPSATAVAIRTKIGVPVFVRPAKPARSLVIESVTVANGQVRTRVRNTGNLHVSVEEIVVRGSGTSGSQTFEREGQGWYVLPGATRSFSVPISPAECSGTSTLAVRLAGHGTTLNGSGSVAPGACGAR